MNVLFSSFTFQQISTKDYDIVKFTRTHFILTISVRLSADSS